MTSVTDWVKVSVLVPCQGATGGCDGFVPARRAEPQQVQIVTQAKLDVFLHRPPNFPDSKELELRGLLRMLNAFRVGNTRRVQEVGHKLLESNKSSSDTDDVLDEEWRVILHNPLSFVIARLSDLAPTVKLVLWQERNKPTTSAGILCARTLDAFCVLALFRIENGSESVIGNCCICGKEFRRRRGERRQTCSGKCRKQKSRRNR